MDRGNLQIKLLIIHTKVNGRKTGETVTEKKPYPMEKFSMVTSQRT